MTVTSTPSVERKVYTGPNDYTFSFEVFESSDLILYHTDTSGVVTTLAEGPTNDYTVTLVTGVDGGTCTLTYAPTDGTLEIRRNLPFVQETVWPNNNPFNAKLLESDLDKTIMLMQQLYSLIAVGAGTTSWKGDWVTLTTYALNDMVIDTITGNIYTCIVPHTAGATIAGDLSNWHLVFDVAALTALEASATAAAVATAADVVTTNADVVLTNADVVITNADVVLTNADVATTNADVVITNQDALDTADDVLLTNADVVTAETYKNFSIQYAIGENPLSIPNEPPEGSAKYWAGISSAGESGLEALDEGNGVGWRFVGREPANYGNIGLNATDISYSNSASSTFGATGTDTVAEGRETTASGNRSHAEGNLTLSYGINSHAEGYATDAHGANSHAEGNSTTATGVASHAEGTGTIAQNPSQHSCGKYNEGTSVTTVVEVGIGTSDIARLNGLEVHSTGAVGMPNLPTTLPAAPGILWVDSGTLKITT